MAVRLKDARATLAAGDYCTSLGEHEVVCASRPQEPTSALGLTAWTGDQDDFALMEYGSALLGPGDDTGRGVGLIRGGPGDDDIRFEAPAPHPFQIYFIEFRGGPGQDVLVGDQRTSGLHGGGAPTT